MRAAILIALVLVLAVAGCGGGNDKKTIPAGNAQSLIAGLDRVSDQFDNGACNGAQAKVSDLQNAADNLPSSVDPEVKKNIQDGLQRLNDLVQRDCQRSETTTTSSTTSSTTPTTTSTTTTTSSSSPTTTSTTSTSTSSSDTGGVEPPNGGTGPGGATGQ